MKSLTRPFFCVLFVTILIFSCNDTTNNKDQNNTDSLSNVTNTEDKRTDELKKLDEFFNVIINSDYKSFKKGSISNETLLRFGVYYWYNFKLNKIEEIQSNEGISSYKIKNNMVNDIAFEYFGEKITEFKPFDDIVYKDGAFLLDGSKHLGLMDNPSAQCLELVDNGNGIFTATVGELFQEVTYSKGPKYTATLKKVDGRYILLDFQNK